MTIERFLQEYTPGEDVTDEVLAELSGISNSEAATLTRKWLSWTDEQILDLQTRLVELTVIDPAMEFECVFKAGLHHSDGGVRSTAIHGLSETGDTAAVSQILELLTSDSDLEVRSAAATAMSSFAAQASEGRFNDRLRKRMYATLSEVLETEDASSELWRRSLEAIGAFNDNRINRYIDIATQAKTPDLKRSALIAMGRTCDPRWLDFVTAELENSDSSIRYEAVNALGEIGEEADAFYLEEPLDDQDLMVQMAAVAAAEKIAGPTAKQLLQIAGQSAEPAVAAAAAEALTGIANEDNLIHPVTPEMASQGMFGAKSGKLADGDVPYDAGEREGWGHIDEEGESFLSPDNVRDDDDDPLSSLMDYEASPGQYEDDD